MTSENEHDIASTSAQTRIARYDQYFDQRTFSYTLRKTAKPPKKSSKKKSVLVVRRLINSKGRLEGTEVDIKSIPLLEVLQNINENVLNLELTRNPPMADPKLFYYSRQGLIDRLKEEKAQETPDSVLVADLETALEYTDEHHANTFTEVSNMLARGEMSYDLLWALFCPNIYIYSRHELTEQDRVLYCRTMEYETRSDGSPYVSLTCDIISRDSSSFGVSREDLSINYFKGTKKIAELQAYPLAMHPEREKLSQHALERGKRYASMKGHVYQEVRGIGVRESINSDMDVSLLKFNAYGRVMLDPVAFRLFQPNSSLNTEVHKRLDPDSLTDEEYMICTPIGLGFCFGAKTWGGFAIDRVEDVVWEEGAFTSLVLGAKQKTLIHSLIKQHNARASSFDDIVRGKGKGLVGLLAGRPGCGKTLTAEAVAEVTHRPLYIVSAGELGIRPEDLDERLARILELAQTWNAVLLLDEAEVFIQMRSMTDVKRNALVSIFLRQLEYYQGILILTTNLIGSVDPAFESRIHFCIHYPDLDFASRRAVWNIFFAKTLKDSKGVTERDIDRLAEREMNGRQIKNAVSSAQSIAMEANLPLSIEHIDAVLDVVSEWNFARQRAKEFGDFH